MAIKTQKFTMSDGKTFDLPELWKGALQNMMNATILGQITPDYDYTGGATIELKLNVLTNDQDYYETQLAYGQMDFVKLDLGAPRKIGEIFPFWDEKSDYRQSGYWVEKFAEWGRTIGRIREKEFFKMLAADAKVPSSRNTVSKKVEDNVLMEAILNDVLALHTIETKHHDGIPKNMINVIVNPFTAKKIRAFLADLGTEKTSNLMSGVLPIGVYDEVTFFESAYFGKDVPYYVMAKTATGVGFVPGGTDIDTPITGTNDRYKGITYRYTQGIIQPDLVIKGKEAEEPKKQ